MKAYSLPYFSAPDKADWNLFVKRPSYLDTILSLIKMTKIFNGLLPVPQHIIKKINLATCVKAYVYKFSSSYELYIYCTPQQISCLFLPRNYYVVHLNNFPVCLLR